MVEYVDGPSLADVVRDRGPLTPANLHGMAVGVAAALTAIHGAGVIHRDLKPSNVLLAPGSPKVIDFGIARPVDPTTIYTQTDQVVGTVAYMSPERLASNGRNVSPAADVFAWGAVVAYAGTGRIPFAADSLPTVALRIMNDEPDLAGLSAPLADLVAAALSKDPADRPTARQLLDQLTATGPRGAIVPLGAMQAAAAPRSPAMTGTRAAPTEVVAAPSRRRAGLAVLALAAAVITLTGAIVAVSTGLIGGPNKAVPTTPAVTTPPPTPTAGSTTSPSASPTGVPLPDGVFPVADYALTQADAVWRAQAIPDIGASCSFADGLRITLGRQDAGSYRCPGPVDSLTDLTLTVDVTLRTAGTCAGIWFRFESLKGYALQVCRDRFQLVTHGVPQSWSVTPLRVLRLDRPLELNERVRVGLVADGEVMRFYRGDTEVGAWAHNLFTKGRVILGVFQDGPAPYEVIFANVKLWGSGI